MSSDDLGFISGRLQGILDQMALDRDQRAEDKREAIGARDQKHAENQAWQSVMTAKVESLGTAVDGTAVIARDSKQWIDTKGNPLIARVDNIHDRMTAFEEEKRIDAAESRGSASVWTWIWGGLVAVAGAIGSVLAALAGLSPETIDKIKGFFHG
jgi:hypothetical protein